MSTFYDSPNDYRSYLAHYGVKGMRWHKHVTRTEDTQNPFRPRNHDREDATNRSNAPKNPKSHDPQLSEQEIASRRQHDQMRSRLESRQRDMERHSAQNRRASDEGQVLSDKKKLEEARQNQRKKRPGRNIPHTAHKPSSRPRSSRS